MLPLWFILSFLQGCVFLVEEIDRASDDLDRDGWSVFEGDCDDYNPEINPEAEEIGGDNIDSNCNEIEDA